MFRKRVQYGHAAPSGSCAKQGQQKLAQTLQCRKQALRRLFLWPSPLRGLKHTTLNVRVQRPRIPTLTHFSDPREVEIFQHPHLQSFFKRQANQVLKEAWWTAFERCTVEGAESNERQVQGSSAIQTLS